MMRFTFTIILLSAAVAYAQSGRIKPDPTPAPRRPSPQPVAARPTPTPESQKTENDEINIESTLIPIPATVLDSAGKPVTNLRIRDFELRIDGKLAEISEIRRTDIPVRIALLFDNSSSVGNAIEFEKAAASRFLRSVLRPEKDRAALFSISTVSRLEFPFTSDVSLLNRTIAALPVPAGATALFDGIIAAAKYLTEEPGQRVIVIISDGDDTASDAGITDVIRALQIANAQVFVVKTTDFENYKLTKSRKVNANLRQLAAERRMEELARETGGAVFSPIDEDEMDAAFRNVVAALSQQYILSYYPDSENLKSGEFRTISLSVPGRPDLVIKTRRGFYIPRVKPQ